MISIDPSPWVWSCTEYRHIYELYCLLVLVVVVHAVGHAIAKNYLYNITDSLGLLLNIILINYSHYWNTITNVTSPLKINTIPPTSKTYFSLTLPLIHYPILTAPAVQRQCPINAPRVTIKRLKEAANAMVANCDRSPHSAQNVIMKACVRI